MIRKMKNSKSKMFPTSSMKTLVRCYLRSSSRKSRPSFEKVAKPRLGV